MQPRRGYLSYVREELALVAPSLTLLPEAAVKREHSLGEVFNGLRQRAPRPYLAQGRGDAAPPAHHRSQRGGALNQAQGRAGRLVARPNARAQAADAGHRGGGE